MSIKLATIGLGVILSATGTVGQETNIIKGLEASLIWPGLSLLGTLVMAWLYLQGDKRWAKKSDCNVCKEYNMSQIHTLDAASRERHGENAKSIQEIKEHNDKKEVEFRSLLDKINTENQAAHLKMAESLGEIKGMLNMITKK